MRQQQALNFVLTGYINFVFEGRSPLLMLRISSIPSPILPLMASDVGTQILDETCQLETNRGNFNINSLPDGM